VSDGTFKVKALDDGRVKISTDTSGERGTSAKVDPRQAIAEIAAEAGLDVTVSDRPAETTLGQEAEQSAAQ